MTLCLATWGSIHSCKKPKGHSGEHWCATQCSAPNEGPEKELRLDRLRMEIERGSISYIKYVTISDLTEEEQFIFEVVESAKELFRASRMSPK